jgi:hypothetical protein
VVLVPATFVNPTQARHAHPVPARRRVTVSVVGTPPRPARRRSWRSELFDNRMWPTPWMWSCPSSSLMLHDVGSSQHTVSNRLRERNRG